MRLLLAGNEPKKDKQGWFSRRDGNTTCRLRPLGRRTPPRRTGRAADATAERLARSEDDDDAVTGLEGLGRRGCGDGADVDVDVCT